MPNVQNVGELSKSSQLRDFRDASIRVTDYFGRA